MRFLAERIIRNLAHVMDLTNSQAQEIHVDSSSDRFVYRGNAVGFKMGTYSSCCFAARRFVP